MTWQGLRKSVGRAGSRYGERLRIPDRRVQVESRKSLADTSCKAERKEKRDTREQEGDNRLRSRGNSISLELINSR